MGICCANREFVNQNASVLEINRERLYEEERLIVQEKAKAFKAEAEQAQKRARELAEKKKAFDAKVEEAQKKAM